MRIVRMEKKDEHLAYKSLVRSVSQ